MTENTDSYTGIDNLEVMAEAVNYNTYLVDLVLNNTSRGQTVLDFGAGAGTFAAPVQAAERKLTCLEPDLDLQKHLRATGLEVVANVEVLPDDSFDCIYSLNVLEHIEDDEAALGQLARVLKPGGTLLIYVPAFQLLFSSMDRKVGHFRRYRRRPLMDLVRKSGFNVQHASYVDSLGFLAALVYRLADRGDGDINRRALATYDRFAFPVSRLLDRLLGRLFGKNVALIARRPLGGQS